MKSKIMHFNEIQNIYANKIKNIYHFNMTVLHAAVKANNLEIVKLLLVKKEIDINIKDSHGKEPIHYSKSDKIKQLLFR